MALYTKDSIDRLKEAVDMVELVGARSDLRRVGSRWVGLLRLVERTAAYYGRYLWESGEAAKARDYLSGRGLGEEVLRKFRIGYAPSAWDRVIVGAQRDGFSPEELAAAGLAQRGRQGG